MARSATGVVRLAAIPLTWLLRNRWNHPAAAGGRGFPSLSKVSKEVTLMVDFRDRN